MERRLINSLTPAIECRVSVASCLPVFLLHIRAEFVQFGVGRQVSAHSCQVHIPAVRLRLAPEPGFVRVDQRAAPAFEDGVDQVLRWGFSAGVQSGIRMVSLIWTVFPLMPKV